VPSGAAGIARAQCTGVYLGEDSAFYVVELCMDKDPALLRLLALPPQL